MQLHKICTQSAVCKGTDCKYNGITQKVFKMRYPRIERFIAIAVGFRCPHMNYKRHEEWCLLGCYAVWLF
jgi:hypothetical protein